MPFRRKPLTIAPLLIFLMNVITGDALTCPHAEYRRGQKCCPMCPPGNRVYKDCTDRNRTSCLPCTEGTFLDKPSERTECFPCANCDAGVGLKVKRLCTTTSDAVCEPLEGHYCIDPKEDGCAAAQTHRSCKPGQYISQTGTATTDTVCIDCTGETYSDGTFTSCQPHTKCESMRLQQIRPGTHSTDSECREQSSDKTIIITISVVVLLLLIGTDALICLIKKRGKQRTGRTIPMVLEQETLNGVGTPETCD
ncbi:tumor necrosis factor receptor superfamily member 14-like [Centroberyx affinis]|uniref:tumor necrosis factor receptor superfamily member 14-like n=1 Tax=Centroberyx affinis TaxID=166261 RepID=UPI003A5C566E